MQMGPACLHSALQHGAIHVPVGHRALQSLLPNHAVHTCERCSQYHLDWAQCPKGKRHFSFLLWKNFSYKCSFLYMSVSFIPLQSFWVYGLFLNDYLVKTKSSSFWNIWRLDLHWKSNTQCKQPLFECNGVQHLWQGLQPRLKSSMNCLLPSKNCFHWISLWSCSVLLFLRVSLIDYVEESGVASQIWQLSGSSGFCCCLIAVFYWGNFDYHNNISLGYFSAPLQNIHYQLTITTKVLISSPPWFIGSP